MGNGGNSIYKIQPPEANPLTDTWTVSTIEIGGTTLASQPAEVAKTGAVHSTRIFLRQADRLLCVDCRRT